MITLVERLWNRISVDAESGCWEWLGCTTDGYARINIKGHNKKVHIALYEEAFGRVPKGLELHHTCENTICVRPTHLEVVTHARNMILSCKFTAQIALIKADSIEMSQRQLAMKYQMSKTHISRILHDKVLGYAESL